MSAYHLYRKPRNTGENSNGMVYPGGNFPEKSIYLSRYYMFSVFTETTEIICTVCLVNQCQASFWGGRWFVLTQAHPLSGVLQMIQLLPISLFGDVFKSGTICQKCFIEISFPNGKRSITTTG